MKKPELLAPAGDYTCFQAALKAGADAVYIGGQRFGARAYAGNFSDTEVVDALKEAHFYGKRLYLTVNTLLKQNEIGELEDFIGPFYEAGLDGVIVQDIGALSLLGTLFPGLELHASTQMTVTDVRGAEFLKQLGVCRVVPARELTLGEIEALCRESGMEVEAFIHGAMCYCYSGQCFFSSLLGGRSGNRGRCAQPCRQPYRILPGQNGQECYPLSLKDMCTIEFIPELIKAGIDSFKIEGRMKKPEYVAGVTSVYRRRIDACLDSPDGAGKVSASDMHILSSLYIRSEISGGYYHRHNGREMITLDQPGYVGCDEAVLQNIRSGILEPELTVPVILEASLHPGQPLRLKAVLAGKDIPAAVSVEGQEVQTASKRPLSREDVEKQLRRTGGSGFRAEDIRLDMADNAFLPVKALNEARRQVLDLLKQKTAQENGPVRTANKCRTDAPATAKGIPSCAAAVSENTQKRSGIPHGPLSVHASVKTISQAYSCLKEGAVRLYFPHTFLRGDWEAALKDMKNEFPGAELYLSFPVILRKQDEARLERLSAALNTGLFDGVQAASLSGRQWLYEKDWKGGVALDHRLYLWNRETYGFWADKMDTYCAPLELNRKGIYALPKKGQEILVYGRIPMMVTANCIRKTAGSCLRETESRRGKTTAGTSCEVLHSDKALKQAVMQEYRLLDRYQAEFPVETDCAYCYNIIYNSVPLSLHAYLGEIAESGAEAVRLDFLEESGAQTAERMSIFHRLCITRSAEASELINRQVNWKFTTGHFKKGAE